MAFYVSGGAEAENDLANRIAERISEIPASGGGAMDLYPATLRQKLTRSMIERIAQVATEEAMKR